MLLDATLEFCDAVSVANAAGTFLLGSQVDTTVARNVGNGRPIYWVITIDTEIITGGSAGTVRFKLASDDTASISTTTSSVHIQTGEYVTDDAVAHPFPIGSILGSWALPSQIFADNDYERYLGVLEVVTTTTITAGKINSFLTVDPVGWTAAPDATN